MIKWIKNKINEHKEAQIRAEQARGYMNASAMLLLTGRWDEPQDNSPEKRHYNFGVIEAIWHYQILIRQKFAIASAAAFVINPNDPEEILVGHRIADDILCIPGGKVDVGETTVEALKREVLEETGLIVEPYIHLGFSDDIPGKNIGKNNNQFVCNHFIVNVVGGTLTNPEPDKIKDWRWVNKNKIEKLFTGCERYLQYL